MTESLPSGAERVRQWFATSPFGVYLGLRLDRLERDSAEISMPFQPVLATTGDVIHGGAISTLIDTAATVAAWSGAEVSDTTRGATASLTINFVAAAHSRDLIATARVTQRGRSLVFCEVDVRDAEARLIAKGLATYRLS